jgi:hypothetical protein
VELMGESGGFFVGQVKVHNPHVVTTNGRAQCLGW